MINKVSQTEPGFFPDIFMTLCRHPFPCFDLSIVIYALQLHTSFLIGKKVVRHSKYKLFSLLLWLKYDPTIDGPRIMRLSNKAVTVVTPISNAHLPLRAPTNIFRRRVIYQQEDYAPKNPSHSCSAILMSPDEQTLLKEYVKSL